MQAEQVTSDSVLNLLSTKIKANAKTPHDSLFILLHAIMEARGFRLVGLGEEGNLVEDKVIPNEWNNSNDAWAFRYRHHESSMTFLLKGLKLGGTLLVHGLALEQKESLSLSLEVSKYVTNTAFSLENLSQVYKDVDELIKVFTKAIISKFIPTVQDIQEQEAQSRASAEPQRSERDPLRIDRDRDRGYDPLRIDRPGRGGGMHPNPYGVGSNDLYPPGFQPFPGGPVWSPPNSGGGSLMGPGHPIFGPRGGPSGGFPGHPPGARFDPYGPPGVNIPPNPRPDHLRPPDWDPDMYM